MFDALLLFAADNAETEAAPTAGAMEQVMEFIRGQGMQFAENLVVAIIIFIVGRWIAMLLVKILNRVFDRAELDVALEKFLSNIAYTLLLVIVILASLDRLGVNTTSLAAVLAAAGLAVGLALQSTLANFAAGVMIILFKPFKIGDFVEAGGASGVVEEVKIFNTFMRSGDNKQIIVPNGAIISKTITNYSTKPTRRIDLVFGCGYDDDLRAVRAYLEQVVSEDERILKDPEPLVAVSELADSSVNFIVRPWVNSGDFGAVKRDLLEKIKLGFDERGFSIPYPQREVHMHKE